MLTWKPNASRRLYKSERVKEERDLEAANDNFPDHIEMFVRLIQLSARAGDSFAFTR
jgi:hypothetical protein